MAPSRADETGDRLPVKRIRDKGQSRRHSRSGFRTLCTAEIYYSKYIIAFMIRFPTRNVAFKGERETKDKFN